MFSLFVVKVYCNFLPLILFVELSRLIPIKAPVYKDISIFNCALCFVVKVYYHFVGLRLLVVLRRFIPINGPVYKDIGIFNCALYILLRFTITFLY